MSNNNHLLVHSVLKAAQAGLAKGLNHLRVATVDHGNGALLEEGESFVPAGGGLPQSVWECRLRTQLS
jgi:hypothetical protein